MRALLVAVAIVAMTVSAEAQMMQGALTGGNKGNESDERHPGAATGPKEEPKKHSNEKEYKSSLDRLPDKKYDPWAKAR